MPWVMKIDNAKLSYFHCLNQTQPHHITRGLWDCVQVIYCPKNPEQLSRCHCLTQTQPHLTRGFWDCIHSFAYVLFTIPYRGHPEQLSHSQCLRQTQPRPTRGFWDCVQVLQQWRLSASVHPITARLVHQPEYRISIREINNIQ